MNLELLFQLVLNGLIVGTLYGAVKPDPGGNAFLTGRVSIVNAERPLRLFVPERPAGAAGEQSETVLRRVAFQKL